MAPRKVRLVVGVVKKKNIDVALDQLAHLSNRASQWVAKAINSAASNGENNHRMVRSNLYISEAWVDEGIKLRRWRPKGFGRAGLIQKKTSHINIVLDERVAGVRAAEPTKKVEEKAPKVESAEQKQEATTDVVKEEKKVPEAKSSTDEAKPSKGLKGFGKRLFRRKRI